jgi:hypothetical protein
MAAKNKNKKSLRELKKRRKVKFRFDFKEIVTTGILEPLT